MAVTPETPPWEAILERGEGEQLVARSKERHQDALVEPMPEHLHPELLEALAGAGIEGLYAHQTDALASAYEGHTIVTTGTASGKSLAFNLPVLDTLCRDRSARALYLYPTKALAQDQARALHALKLPHLRPAIYDGDTPKEERRAIRSRSNLILTNPDMLHVGALPNHSQWGDLLANLAWVVVDEAHTYRGVFGSHVANVLRRLRRLALAYGTEPRFMLASATIANPVELAERLVGDEVRLVARDGAPRAERRIAMWNPPLVDERTGARASALGEAADLLADLVESETRTICFLRSRRGVELIQQFTKLRLEDRGRADLAERVAPYRAGYTPMQRREIEQRLMSGELLAVVTTSALELGIDVGELDAAICVTFPGTVASLRQMWGRAGRRNTGLALYVAGADALDQFFCRHPDQFLDRPVESAILDHESEEIFLAHLCAAAYELPLSPGDEEFLGDRWEPAARRLVSLGQLRERAGRYLPRGEGYPAGADRAALVVAGLGGGDRVRGRRGDRLGGDGARLRRRARRLGVPAHGPLVPGRAAGPGQPPGAGHPVHRRLLHPVQARDRHVHRGGGRPPRGGRLPAELRHRERDRAGHRLPAQARVRPRGPGPGGAGHARAALHHPGAVVGDARAGSGRGLPAGRAPGFAARRRARPDRRAAADRHVRPLGHRRPVHRLPPADRAARRCSSTTATPAAWASRAWASSSSSAWWPTPPR